MQKIDIIDLSQFEWSLSSRNKPLEKIKDTSKNKNQFKKL
jgi:hypothetical protein